MADLRSSLRQLREDHPLFFWGMASIATLLLALTLTVAIRIPQYASQMAMMDRGLDEAARETRDSILTSQTRRSDLAIALLQREMRLRALERDEVHLAIDMGDSTLSLRHGGATLRTIPIQVGADSVIRAPDGRTWRFVRGLGERHLQGKERSPEIVIPEWVYVSRGESVPPQESRTVAGGGGRYVLRLNDESEIYSRPADGPLAIGVKPGSFMADEDDLEAIFEALRVETPVYIY